MKGTYRCDRWSHHFYSQDFLARARHAGNPDKVPVLEPCASISCRCGCRALRHPSRWDHVACRESILMIVSYGVCFSKSATDVGLHQSTLCASAELEDSSLLVRSHHTRSQLADAGSSPRAPRDRAHLQVLEYGEPRHGEFELCATSYPNTQTTCS